MLPDDGLGAFRAAVAGCGRTKAALSRHLGISQGHLGDLLSGRRMPAPTLAVALQAETGFPASRWRDAAILAATTTATRQALREWSAVEELRGGAT